MKNTDNKLIAITGGIGAGKSVISKILRCLGFFVYDCDENAKRLMDSSKQIQNVIKEQISVNAVADGKINRAVLAGIVFQDSQKLQILNSIVHKTVLNDIEHESKKHRIMFVETAILYQSHIDKIVDQVWEVVAPEETRIARVMKRNNFSREQVIDRIKSQIFVPDEIHKSVIQIINDDINPVLPQVQRLLETIK